MLAACRVWLIVVGLLPSLGAGTALAQQPLRLDDLRREAKDAAPALAKILTELAQPADELTLADGTTLRVAPLYASPRASEGPLTVRPLGEEQTKTLPRAEVASVRPFEQHALERVKELLARKDDVEATRTAEKILRAALRFHRGRRAPDDPAWQPLQARLADNLLEARRRLLRELEADEALRQAESWLPLYPPASPLRAEIRSLWLRQADAARKAGNFAKARAWLDRLDATFLPGPYADTLRNALRDRAAQLLKESQEQNDVQAIRQLQDALNLWPRLPGLRDELEKRKGTARVLYVAVPELPEFLSPATAWTDTEKRAVELLFEGLVEAVDDPALGRLYRPVLAEKLPSGTGDKRRVQLRRDVFFSDGERFTSADVRHTVQLLTQAGRTNVWRDLLEQPRLEGGPYRFDLTYRQGLLDPLAPLTFKILPQAVRGRPLTKADDPEFARQPVGTGPYRYAGRKRADGRTYAVFQANPYYVRGAGREPGPTREIRLFAWNDVKDLSKPAAQLVLGVRPEQFAALRDAGYANVRALPDRRVYFLGVNHRNPSLAKADVRRAIAHAIDRQGLLDRHFKTPAVPGAKQPRTANGPFPRQSWAASPAPRVPAELHQPELARSLARKVKKDVPRVAWTLKYPEGDPRLEPALTELVAQVTKNLQEAGIEAAIKLQGLPPHRLREAIEQRDFDLVYHRLDEADDPVTLARFFDPSADATKPGGSNVLGTDQDAKLQGLLNAALRHRQFATVREIMHGVHAHLHETMPLVPLWQLPAHVAAHPSLPASPREPWSALAQVLE